jgi:hypothetical protein
VEEPLGDLGTIVMREDSRPGHSRCIGQDGDRDGGGRQGERPPPSVPQHARECCREGHEGDEGADPATRLGNFQARVGEGDDVPLTQDGYPEDPERVLRRVGGKALEGEGDGVEDNLGGRDHE